MLQHLQRTKVTFAIRIQHEARLIDRDVLAYCRHRVLQNPARTPMHMHVAASDQRQPETTADFTQTFELLPLPAIGQQFDGNP